MVYLEYFCAAIIGTLSAARITRLITWDAFPPTMKIRDLWDKITREGDYALLFHCPWCMGFWVTLGITAWGFGTDFNRWWWIINAVFGLSYVAAMIIVHDGDD